MFKKIKSSILISSTAITMLVSVLVPSFAAQAACTQTASDIGSGVTSASSSTGNCSSGTNVTSGIKSVAKTLTGILSVVVGIISVFAIILAGAQYITSGGNNDKTNKAKNTLLYAVVGLVVAALAGTISLWVLRTTSTLNQ